MPNKGPEDNYFTCQNQLPLESVTLKDIDKDTKKQLETFYDYADIFSKCTTDIGKIDLVQMTLQPKDNIKPLDQKPYMLPLCHHALLWQTLADLEKAGIISPSTSNFAISVIIVPETKTQPHMKSLTEWSVTSEK